MGGQVDENQERNNREMSNRKDCSLPHIYNKNLPSNYPSEQPNKTMFSKERVQTRIAFLHSNGLVSTWPPQRLLHQCFDSSNVNMLSIHKSWWDVSTGRGACHHACWPAFDIWPLWWLEIIKSHRSSSDLHMFGVTCAYTTQAQKPVNKYKLFRRK